MTQDNSKTMHRIKQIAAMLDDALILAQPDGIIYFVNADAVRIFGKNLLGQRLHEMLSNIDIKAAFVQMEAGEAIDEIIYKTVEPVAYELKIRMRQLDDGTVALLCLDMTSMRNLENVRRDFVANVSHELRSPLTSLAGFIETMLDGDVPDQAMRKRFLQIMEEEAMRMSRLLDDLLSLSRVEVAEHIVPSDAVNLGDLLKTVVTIMEGRAAQRGMDVDFEDVVQTAPSLRADDDIIISGSYDELTEVFVNLLENAIKYGFEKSQICIRLGMTAPDIITVDVTNFGEGIEARHLPRLTERFYRVDKARSRQIGGTGLGLAIVKHIVNRHRGTLTAASNLGQTTKFSVTLPLKPR